ncbi:hypothetical protein C5E51_16755 [Nocardia nova]|uniref:DUF2637 domain-containing protein n=1 Tax=Nocardia nova TaxID=37330 RepID=UPI000CEA2847|nr:DUF2637 domain-containing protein [Nocardia nova]PPJ07824.1 hypothetical protein C5E51_16755 [Nocardia nova]
MNDTMSPDQTTPSPTVAHQTGTPAQVSPQASQSAWNPAEVVALLSLAAVSIAASSWSAIALHGVAQMSGITSWLAWGAPVIVDGPIVQAAFALVTLNRRERAGVVIPKATRWFFWGELAAAELVSLIGNGVHAWNSDGLQLSQMAAAVVAGAAPVAALATTHALTALMEVPRTPQTQATPPVAPATAGDNQATAVEIEATAVEIEATAPDSEATAGVADATAERDAEIWRLHREGLSYREIAPIVALHYGTVGKIIGRIKAESDAAASQLALPAPNNVRSIAG